MLVLVHQKETMEGSQPPWRKSYVAKAICRYIVEACCDTKHKERSKHVWEQFPAICIQLSLATVAFKWISFSMVELLSLLTELCQGNWVSPCVSTNAAAFADVSGTVEPLLRNRELKQGIPKPKATPHGRLVLGSRLHLGYPTIVLWGLALVGLCFIPNTN